MHYIWSHQRETDELRGDLADVWRTADTKAINAYRMSVGPLLPMEDDGAVDAIPR